MGSDQLPPRLSCWSAWQVRKKRRKSCENIAKPNSKPKIQTKLAQDLKIPELRRRSVCSNFSVKFDYQLCPNLDPDLLTSKISLNLVSDARSDAMIGAANIHVIHQISLLGRVDGRRGLAGHGKGVWCLPRKGRHTLEKRIIDRRNRWGKALPRPEPSPMWLEDLVGASASFKVQASFPCPRLWGGGVFLAAYLAMRYTL